MKIKKRLLPSLLLTFTAGAFFSSPSIATLSHFDRHKLNIDDKPEFTSIKNTDQKKQEFINYFYPIIVNANIDVLKKREIIKKSRSPLDIAPICKKYREDCQGKNYKQRLLSKVDLILPSMAIAQGAIESGWGSSAYARKGNNFYGIYCYASDCGASKKRSAKLKRYRTPEASIYDYVLTLNRHDAYRELRKIRANSKRVDDWYRGLKKYSSKSSYSKMVNRIVISNDLKVVDEKMFSYFMRRNLYKISN